MKMCVECNRLNLDDAEVCIECGGSEFVGIIPLEED